MSVIPRIHVAVPGFSAAERAVAQAILNNPQAIVRLSVVDVADRAGVSTAAVTRFCQELGFTGFRDLKVSLALELVSFPAAAVGEVGPDDPAAIVAEKVIEEELRALRELRELINGADLERAIELLRGAERILVLGMGSSLPVALDAYYRFMRIGLPVVMPPESHMQPVTASVAGPRDVLFIVSHSGRTQEILIAAKWARRRGARVIALTSFTGSPLARHAEVNLVTPVPETRFRVEAMAARTAHIAIVDVLYVALSVRDAERSSELIAWTARAIDEQRAGYEEEK